MNKAERIKLVTEGFDLDRRIKELEPRLKEIKAILAGCANGLEAEFEGQNCSVKISFPPGRCELPPKKAAEAFALAGLFREALFPPAPCVKFKDVARVLLPADKAKALVELCEGESSARVAFKGVE